MSKKRGLSVDEKRKIILDIFHESKTVWLLKDLEKVASKKGVVLQTVKDITMGLVHDDLVSTDKVGTSNFFWSLPSDAANKRRKRKADLTAQAPEARARREKLEAEVAALKSAEREKALRELEVAKARMAEMEAELAKYAASDPKHLERVLSTTKTAHEACNRWTDNIFLLRQFLEKQFGRGESVEGLFKGQDVDEDFDYLPALADITAHGNLKGRAPPPPKKVVAKGGAAAGTKRKAAARASAGGDDD